MSGSRFAPGGAARPPAGIGNRFAVEDHKPENEPRRGSLSQPGVAQRTPGNDGALRTFSFLSRNKAPSLARPFTSLP